MNVLGASVREDTVTFAVWAPRCRSVEVAMEGRRPQPMTRGADDVFTLTMANVAPGTRYRYRLDGERYLPDPTARWQPEGVHGPSAVVDSRRFLWTDEDFRGHAPGDLVIYELHVGAFTAAGTFEAIIQHLPALVDLGVTAVQLMPVAEFPGSRNWGYDGVHLYAPQSTYGGPRGLRRLVDACHAAGLSVLLDVVYNHLGPEGNHLAEYGPYFSDRYKTPWGPAVNFDGEGSHGVRRHVVENGRAWVSEFHIDGFRLDAIYAIHDASPVHILTEFAEAVHGEGARPRDRRVPRQRPSSRARARRGWPRTGRDLVRRLPPRASPPTHRRDRGLLRGLHGRSPAAARHRRGLRVPGRALAVLGTAARNGEPRPVSRPLRDLRPEP